MKKKKHINLKMTVTENHLAAEVVLESDEVILVQLTNDEPKPVRVIGFRQPTLTEEELLDFAYRRAPDFEDRPADVLKKYIHDREKSMYEHLKELRKIMRKITISANSRKNAIAALKNINNSK